MRARLVNKYFGRVRRVSGDKSQVTLGLPRGGKITCKNSGFEVGDEVCFVLDTAKKKVLRLIPKDIADARVNLGSDPVALSFVNAIPPPEEKTNPNKEEGEIHERHESTDTDTDTYEYSGQVHEEDFDRSLDEYRDFTTKWQDPNEHTPSLDYGVGIED